MRHPTAAALALLLAACGGPSDDPVVLLRKERDPGQRGATLAALVKEKGPKEGDLWDRLLRESDPEIARLAASALGRAAGDPGWRKPTGRLLDSLIDAAGRPEPQVRAEAVHAVALLYPEDPRVPPRILPFLADPALPVRRAAVDAFERFATATGGMDLAPLRKLLKDDAVALDAATALAACGDASPAALALLVSAVEERSDPARSHAAAEALAVLGPRAGGSAVRLSRALPGSPPGVAAPLCDALGLSASPDSAVAAALARALESRDEEVSAAAALALVRLGKGEGAAARALVPLSAAKSPEARTRAAEGLLLLGKGGEPEWETLLSLAGDASPDGRRAAAAVEAVGRVCAAGRMPPGASTEVIETAADDGRLPLRRAAARARAAISVGR